MRRVDEFAGAAAEPRSRPRQGLDVPPRALAEAAPPGDRLLVPIPAAAGDADDAGMERMTRAIRQALGPASA